MFKHILVPLDSSRFSSRALRYAIEIAQRFDAEVTLMQVVKPATPVITTTVMGTGIESPTTAKLTARASFAEDKRNMTRAKRYLSRKVREIKSQGIKGTYRVEVGETAQSIMRFAQEDHMDIVIMTTRGKGGLKRVIMGSVTDEVVRGLGKPVLVINPQFRRK
ncbi:universal stress protein [Chloroflexota bacterium]